MKELAEMLKQYLEQNPPQYEERESVLDMFYWNYVEHDNCDSERIRRQFDTLRKLIKYPPEEFDEVFYVVSDLCLEHGRLAFIEGLKVGMLLMQETRKE